MKIIRGFALPDDEEHLVPFVEESVGFRGGPTYQFKKFLRAIPFVGRFGLAIDVGAHCGLWTRVLAGQFDLVEAFEPREDLVGILCRNLDAFGVRMKCQVHISALGNESREVSIRTTPNSSGDSFVWREGEQTAHMNRLDDMLLDRPVDFMKIDTEGYEVFVLQGGEQTIRRDRPVILVEQKPGHGARYKVDDIAAVTLLESWGARQEWVMGGDYLMTW